MPPAFMIYRKEKIKNERMRILTKNLSLSRAHYNIATTFEFVKEGTPIITCPYCDSPKPHDQKKSDITCPSCGHSYIIPNKISDLV